MDFASLFDLDPEHSLIQREFSLLDKVIIACEEKYHPELEQPAYIFCLVALRTKYYLLGVTSLILQGLAQESGAMYRPVIEGLELLAYLRIDAKNHEKFLSNKMPQAGDRARIVQGQFKDVKDYLSSHSAHIDFSPSTVKHMFSQKHNGKLRLRPVSSLEVIRTNLRTVAATLRRLQYELFKCLTHEDFITDEMAKEHLALNEDSKEIIGPYLTV